MRRDARYAKAMAHHDDDDDVDGTPLNERERRAVRRLIRDHQRMIWFWNMVRVWAGWLSAATIGAYAAYDAVVKLLKMHGGR